MLEVGAAAVAADEQVLSVSEVAALQKWIAELERVLGKKTMENEVLKAAVELARKKTDLAHVHVRDRGFSIGIVASALGVSRREIGRMSCWKRNSKRGQEIFFISGDCFIICVNRENLAS